VDLVVGYPRDQARLVSVPVVRKDGSVSVAVPACLVADPEDRQGKAVVVPDPPFTLAAEIFERSGHADLLRVFLPFGLDRRRRATGVLEVGYHRSAARRPDRTQIEALRAAAAQVAVAVDTARLYEGARRYAEQLELSAEISRAIASSIDIDETLQVVARNMVRLVDASLCQIALFDEDGSGWYGAAASDQEKLWQRQRGERPERSFLFRVLDDQRPLAIEDVRSSELVPRAYAQSFGVRALLAVPLLAGGRPIGAAVLAERQSPRRFTAEEITQVQAFAHQAAIAINNARLHAQTEEERHIQKDVVLLGFGQWGQRAYQHLLTLKQFFNFRIHVVDRDDPARHDELLACARQVQANGDAFYLDSPSLPAHKQLQAELETSCYVITYVATPASTHLPMVARYYDLSDVIVIEKPLGASPDAWRAFLDGAPGGVELVAADHYYFKLEVRLLQVLLTEERTLRDFLDTVDEIRLEILEAKPLTGAASEIGVVADLIPHAFAIVSLFTPVDRIELDPDAPLLVGRHEPAAGTRETYARMQATFLYRGRRVRLVIDVGKGVEDAKWITLYGERRTTGRSGFYKFDFSKGEAIDGTQSNVRAAIRKIREPGVPDNAQLTMLRHVIEKRHPAVGILSIREAIRSNQRIQELETMAAELLASGSASIYPVGSRPAFAEPRIPRVEADGVIEPVTMIERERARHG
jgi:GAF domain-containing protein